MPVYALGDARPELPAADRHWIAPSADVMGRVRMKPDASIWYGAVLRGDNDWMTIGERTNIQDNSVLHTDDGCPLEIGPDVTVGHQVMLHGCTIGEGSLIGIGATVLNRARIGRFCIIGAHALITEDKEIPDYSLVVGAPGKVIRTHGEEVADLLKASAAHYVGQWQRHAKDLTLLQP